ncbi:alpha/beta hydrolase family protein [Burkholderia sp. 22PA0106]|uniref:alpha/beta hydrolase family protein n=1 Tax=Burkholderia sp. 22PA0106 TaxID=3237371 RepID=UPI0039C465C9
MKTAHGFKHLLQTLALAAFFANRCLAAPMSLDAYLAITAPPATTVFHYGPAPSQIVAFYRPRGAGPFPVAILVHGGCWQSRYGGLPQMGAIGALLAEHGIAAWNVEYRRVDEPGGGYPGMYQDMGAAIDLLRSRASALDLDASRVLAIGHSAGAQLALWAAARSHLPPHSSLHVPVSLPIPTVISLGGFGDLERDANAIRQACRVDVATLTGSPDDRRNDVFSDTSPAALPSGTARVIAIHGADDTIAPPALAQDYVSRVRKAHGQARLIVVPDSGHLDEVSLTSPVWPILKKEIHDALQFSQPAAR